MGPIKTSEPGTVDSNFVESLGGIRSANSSTGDHLDDLQAVSILQLNSGEFRRADGLLVELHHHTLRKQSLGFQKIIQGTGQFQLHIISIGSNSTENHMRN